MKSCVFVGICEYVAYDTVTFTLRENLIELDSYLLRKGDQSIEM